jgi:hypothetical protein
MDAPCCDVFEIEDGKIKRFDCYAEGSVISKQLGLSRTAAGPAATPAAGRAALNSGNRNSATQPPVPTPYPPFFA